MQPLPCRASMGSNPHFPQSHQKKLSPPLGGRNTSLSPCALATALPLKLRVLFFLQHSWKRHLNQESEEKRCQAMAALPTATEAVRGSKAGVRVGTRTKITAAFRSFMVGAERQPGSAGKETKTETAEKLPGAWSLGLLKRLEAKSPVSWRC